MGALPVFAGRGDLRVQVVEHPDAAGYAVAMFVPDGLVPVMSPDEARALADFLVCAAEAAERGGSS
jgi:hypothetical protein